MELGVIHEIHDPQAWQKALDDHEDFPPDFSLLVFVEAVNRSQAMCIWRASSAEAVQEALDQRFGHAAVNKVFPIDVHLVESQPDDSESATAR